MPTGWLNRKLLRNVSKSATAAHVLVVGGSFAGLSAVDTLVRSDSPMHVTLVSRTDFFEYLPSSLHCLVRPDYLDKVTTSLRGGDYKFVHGTVVTLRRHEAEVRVHYRDERVVTELIPFDFCIWACGTGYPEPIYNGSSTFLEMRKKMFRETRVNILNAKSLLVVGGGPVGVELAAELTELPVAALCAPRSVTLVCSTFELLVTLPERARWYAEMWLRNKGVRVVTGGRLAKSEDDCTLICTSHDGTVPTRFKGADAILWATGTIKNRALNAMNHGGLVASEDLDPNGRVFVRATLQLPRARHIFACGDCSVVACDQQRDLASKTAYAAIEAGRLAARNVMLLDAAIRADVQLSLNQLLRYPEHAFPLGTFPQVFCISLGKSDGIFCIGPLVITGKIAVLAKRTIEKLNVRAFSGSRFHMHLFTLLERVFFFIAAIIQALFEAKLPDI